MTAHRIVDRWHRLKNDRSTHEAVWQEIAEYLRPLRAEFLAQTRTPGARRDAKVFDSTPLIAADNFTGGIYSMMTNPANRWFALKLEDDDLNDYRERAVAPSISQQNVTVIVRDFDTEAALLRLVAENKMPESDLPPRLRARLAKPDNKS